MPTVTNKYAFLFMVFLAISQISFIHCEQTGLKDTLSTLSYLISWLPKASIPAAPSRLISLLLNMLVKQLKTTLLVLDENRPATKFSTSSTMVIPKNRTRNLYYPEMQLGRCLLRYTKKEYPEMMQRLKMNTIESIIDAVAEYGNSLLRDNRENSLHQKNRIKSETKEVTSNEIGYATNLSSRQLVVLPPLPMVPYLRRRRLAMPWYNYNSNYHMNYNRNYNAGPSSVQHIDANIITHSATLKSNRKAQDHSNKANSNRRMDVVDSYHSKEKTNETKISEESIIKPTEKPTPYNSLFWMLTEKPSSGSSRVSPNTKNNNLQNHKMDIEYEDESKNHIARNSRAINDLDSSVMYVGPRQFPSSDGIIQTPSIDEKSGSTVNVPDNQHNNDDLFNFETILLEGLGINPNSIKKWSLAYCGKEYVIDVLKRAEDSIFLI